MAPTLESENLKGRMTQTLDQFYGAHNGKRVDFDGAFGAQCKDLFSFYNRDVVGNPMYVVGDAWELWNNCPPEFYEKVSTPKKGDVAIWKQSFGGFGHVAIVWDGGKFFSQNYPDTVNHTPSSLQSIPTSQLTGYLRPKNIQQGDTMEFWRNLVERFKVKFSPVESDPKKDKEVIAIITKLNNGSSRKDIVKKFGEGDIRIRKGVSDSEWLANAVGIFEEENNVKNLPTF